MQTAHLSMNLNNYISFERISFLLHKQIILKTVKRDFPHDMWWKYLAFNIIIQQYIFSPVN